MSSCFFPTPEKEISGSEIVKHVKPISQVKNSQKSWKPHVYPSISFHENISDLDF